MANLRIKLVKSLNGRLEKHIATAHSLGLRKIGQETVQPDNTQTRGGLVRVSVGFGLCCFRGFPVCGIAAQPVQRYAVDPCQRLQLVHGRRCVSAFPAGDRLPGYTELIGQLHLRESGLVS